MHLMDASDVTNAVNSERQSRKAKIFALKSMLETNTNLDNEKNRRVEEDEKLKNAIVKYFYRNCDQVDSGSGSAG